MKKDSSSPKFFPFGRENRGIYYLFITILIGTGFYCGAKIGWAFSFEPDHIAVFWPSNTIILTALVLMPLRKWWLCFLAMALVYFSSVLQVGFSELRTIIFFVANCSEVLIAAVALRRFIQGQLRFTRLRDVVIFMMFAVLIAPAISATIASIATYSEPKVVYWLAWRVWFLGDALGHLTLTPLLLTWIMAGSAWFKTVSRQRILEASALTVCLIAVGQYAFGGEFGSPGNLPALVYIPLPLLLWAAVRFGPQGTYTAVFGITLLSIWNSVEGRGPFTTMTPADNVLALQLFLVAIAIPIMFLSTLICERKKVEQKLLERTEELIDTNTALNESEARYADLYDNSPDLYASVDAGTARIKQCNQTLADKLGYSKTEIIGRPIFDIYHTDCMEAVKKTFQSFVETGEIRNTELQLKRRDGTKIDVNLNVSSVRDDNGKVLFSRSCWIDITDQKRAVTSSQKSEERYRSIFNTVSDALLIISQNGDILEINPTACNFYGYNREELLNMNVNQLIIPEYHNEFFRFVHDIDKEGFFQGATIDVRKDGSTFHTDVRGTNITFRDEECVIAVVRDISMRKQAEKDKDKLESLLRQTHKMEAIGTLASGIAHDFNNILAPILGFTEIMMTDVDNDDNKRRVYLGKIYNATLRARELVKQILSFSRQSEREVQPIQPHVVIKEALKLLRSSIPSTIEIRTEIDETGTVLADPTQIHQIIMNLCTNAYFSMKKTGGILSISLDKITIKSDDIKVTSLKLTPGDYIRLVVGDTGCGMSKSIKEKVFDPYFTTKEKGEGTGLGLSIVHGIVRDYNGHISVYSETGHGTTFYVYLPQHQSDSEKHKRIADSHVSRGTENVMIVDDEEVIANVTHSILEGLGYRGTIFTNSVEALNAFIAEPDIFDLMITDMTMPQMTGIELSQKILSKRKDFPIILCTGFSDLINEGNVKNIGIKGFLLKPILIKDLARKVREVLDMPTDTQ